MHILHADSVFLLNARLHIPFLRRNCFGLKYRKKDFLWNPVDSFS